jgi:hypothetical protein
MREYSSAGWRFVLHLMMYSLSLSSVYVVFCVVPFGILALRSFILLLLGGGQLGVRQQGLLFARVVQ